MENNPTLGSFVLFVWLRVFDTASSASAGKPFFLQHRFVFVLVLDGLFCKVITLSC